MNFEKLKTAINDYTHKAKISKEVFCQRIGITPQGLDKMIKEKVMKVENLEALSKELRISPCTFFDDYKQIELSPGNVSEPGNDYTPNKCKELNDKLQRLENELRLKDDLIKTYHQLISSKGTN